MELLSRELSEEEILEKKKLFRAKIVAIVPEADHFVDILEQTCQVGLEWSCGISRFKHGIGALREAYEESGKALRYHRASEKRGMIWYKNIETLFSQDLPDTQEILRDLVGVLANPEERGSAVSQLESALESICAQKMTVMQFQTVCIRCLIELNGLLQGMKGDGIDLHGQLNKMLEKILLCDNYRMTIDCMIGYAAMLVQKLNDSDEVQLGGGVIKEVQLFIRRHYNETITLNMLADPEKKVSDISMMAGYENPRYFSKVFKQFTGMTPSEYRESLNKEM